MKVGWHCRQSYCNKKSLLYSLGLPCIGLEKRNPLLTEPAQRSAAFVSFSWKYSTAVGLQSEMKERDYARQLLLICLLLSGVQ